MSTLGESPAMLRRERIGTVDFRPQEWKQQRVTVCNLCGEDVFTTIVHRDRYEYPVSADVCNRCGLVFLNPRMDTQGYGVFYERTYRPLVSAYHGYLINAETIQEEQADYAQRLGAFLAPWLPKGPGATLLDIGGSTGVVARILAQRFGLRAEVLDPAPEELERARGFGIEVHRGFIEDYDPGDTRYDLVTMCQTIDHLLDVKASLAKVRTVVKDSGFFFVDIVDLRAAYLRNASVEEAIKVDHPYYFTEPTVESFLALSGFKTVAKVFESDHLHVGYLARPSTAASTLPSLETVSHLFREIRLVQNTPARR